ncbi:MAG TPA: MoaD/ThiS family protein [Candidatus Angelobacter sp.]
MAITFHIPSYLSAFAGNRNSVTLNTGPPTVGEALESLWQLHPGLRDRIVDEQGEVRQHINIFVGNECVRFTGGLATQVPKDAELLIVPAVSGGLAFPDEFDT